MTKETYCSAREYVKCRIWQVVFFISQNISCGQSHSRSDEKDNNQLVNLHNIFYKPLLGFMINNAQRHRHILTFAGRIDIIMLFINCEVIMIEFKTQLDVVSQQALNKRALKKLILIFGIFSLVLIAIGSIRIITADQDADITSAVLLIIIGVIFTPLLLLLNSIGQKNVYKNTPYLRQPIKEIYRFYEDNFEHLQKKGESFYSKTNSDYTYFSRVISTPTHYFMYISSRQCHVIDKSHITQGSCEELDEILMRKLPVGKFKKSKR